MRSSLPEAVTRTPVRWGRVSSREADRATRAMVSTKALAGTVSTPSSGASGSLGKSSGGSVRRWKRAEPETTSTSCWVGAMLEGQLVLWKRTDHIEQEPARDNDDPRRGLHRLQPDADAHLHVGRLQLGAAFLHTDQHPGQRLNRAAGRGAANSYGKTSEERFTGNGELQLTLPI